MDLNTQPIERIDWTDDPTLDVIEVWKTIQGEGPFAGCPAVFIRLAGCNLQCPLCDTNYTKGRARWHINVIANAVEHTNASLEGALVVLTGGEPFRQNLAPLVRLLKKRGHRIQIETNGTLCPPADFPWDAVTIVCSPKTPKIHKDLQPHIAAFKYVIEAGFVDGFDGLPETTLGTSHGVARPDRLLCREDVEIYCQPLDQQDGESNWDNLQATVASVIRHGYRLCLQMQKIIGLP